MSNSLEETIKGIMADIFGMEPSAIGDASSRETLEQWDSANHISLVFALETEFSLSFEVEEIESMLTFRDVVETVQAKV